MFGGALDAFGTPGRDIVLGLLLKHPHSRFIHSKSKLVPTSRSEGYFLVGHHGTSKMVPTALDT